MSLPRRESLSPPRWPSTLGSRRSLQRTCFVVLGGLHETDNKDWFGLCENSTGRERIWTLVVKLSLIFGRADSLSCPREDGVEVTSSWLPHRKDCVVGIFLGVPPIFHHRFEITLTEAKWRADSATVIRFATNDYSALSREENPGGKV